MVCIKKGGAGTLKAGSPAITVFEKYTTNAETCEKIIILLGESKNGTFRPQGWARSAGHKMSFGTAEKAIMTSRSSSAVQLFGAYCRGFGMLADAVIAATSGSLSTMGVKPTLDLKILVRRMFLPRPTR